MNISIEQVHENNEIVYPSFELTCQLTGVYLDLKKMRFLLQALQKQSYIHPINDGLPCYLSVKETIQYYLQLSNESYTTDVLLQMFQLQHVQQQKTKHLTESERALLNFIKPFLFANELAVFEQPFQQLEKNHKKIVLQLIEKLSERGCNILLLSDNLEHLYLATNDIYRIDKNGLHRLETKEETVDEQAPAPIIKIEKIHARHQDKTLLFNPPEIDYIESIDGQAHLHIAGQSYTCPYTLTDLEKKLLPYGFYRCHRSYIVNLQKVREMITWTKNSYSLKLNVQSDVTVPLSRTKLTELKELLHVN